MNEYDAQFPSEKLFGEAEKLDALFEAAHRAEQAIEGAVEAAGRAIGSDDPTVSEQGRYVLERLRDMVTEAIRATT